MIFLASTVTWKVLGSVVTTTRARRVTFATCWKGFKRQGVDAVVLDLRSNGGGSLPESVDCTGLFIDRGPVVQVKNSAGDKEQLDDETPGMSWDGPLVVVTSKFSASASEILAGAIQDYKRGLIVGDTATHGKGTVQQLRDVGRIIFPIASTVPQDYGALKVTMQQFYRPSGDSTQKRGVLADITLPSISDHMDVGESDLKYALEFDQIEKASFAPYPFVNKDLVAQDQRQVDRSGQRSDDFKKLVTDIERYKVQKDRKTVTLNEAKFLEQRKEFDADKQDEETLEEQINSDSTNIERTFYLDEVLAITVDYIEALGAQKLARK